MAARSRLVAHATMSTASRPDRARSRFAIMLLADGRCLDGKLEQPAADLSQVAVFVSQGLAQRRHQSRDRALGKRDEQSPSVVVLQLGSQDGLQPLRQIRPWVGEYL